jgi:hypothetical protein
LRSLYVAGCLPSLILADFSIQPLNQSVVLLKDREIIFTNDAWLLAVDIDMSSYEEAVTAVKANILSLEVHRKEAVSIFELNQIKTLLDTLEVRLN